MAGEGLLPSEKLILPLNLTGVAEAVEFVEQVLAEASIQAWIRAALINVLFTPTGKSAKK